MNVRADHDFITRLAVDDCSHCINSRYLLSYAGVYRCRDRQLTRIVWSPHTSDDSTAETRFRTRMTVPPQHAVEVKSNTVSQFHARSVDADVNCRDAAWSTTAALSMPVTN